MSDSRLSVLRQELRARGVRIEEAPIANPHPNETKPVGWTVRATWLGGESAAEAPLLLRAYEMLLESLPEHPLRDSVRAELAGMGEPARWDALERIGELCAGCLSGPEACNCLEGILHPDAEAASRARACIEALPPLTLVRPRREAAEWGFRREHGHDLPFGEDDRVFFLGLLAGGSHCAVLTMEGAVVWALHPSEFEVVATWEILPEERHAASLFAARLLAVEPGVPPLTVLRPAEGANDPREHVLVLSGLSDWPEGLRVANTKGFITDLVDARAYVVVPEEEL